MVGKAQKSHGARSGLYGGCSNGVPPIHFSQAEHNSRLGEMRDACKILVIEAGGKRPLGRPKHRREDNIRTDLR